MTSPSVSLLTTVAVNVVLTVGLPGEIVTELITGAESATVTEVEVAGVP